jgi:hypothetical protein
MHEDSVDADDRLNAPEEYVISSVQSSCAIDDWRYIMHTTTNRREITCQ